MANVVELFQNLVRVIQGHSDHGKRIRSVIVKCQRQKAPPNDVCFSLGGMSYGGSFESKYDDVPEIRNWFQKNVQPILQRKLETYVARNPAKGTLFFRFNRCRAEEGVQIFTLGTMHLKSQIDW